MSEERKASGRENTFLNVSESYVEMVIEYLVDHLADFRPIRALIQDLSPEASGLAHATLPGIAGLAVDRIPDSAFKSPERAAFVRNVISEVGKRVGQAIGRGGKMTDEELEDVAKEAINEVESQQVLIDDCRFFHAPSCVNMLNHPSQRQQRGRKGQQPQQQPRAVSLKIALEQGLHAAPCCHTWAQKEILKPETSPETAAQEQHDKNRRPSPFDVIGRMETQERSAFNRWINGMNADQRKQVIDALHELDSMDEFRGLMAMKPAIRLEMLPLLRNRNAKHWIKEFLGAAGACIQRGWARLLVILLRLWEHAKRFAIWLKAAIQQCAREISAAFAQPALSAQARYQQQLQRVQKPVPWSLKKMLGLF